MSPLPPLLRLALLEGARSPAQAGRAWRSTMRMQKIGHAIGISLIGLTFLLTAPDIGASQEAARSGVSADKPLSFHLSALHSNSWFTRHGIWVRREGVWAFRPTVRRDYQAHIRCQLGYGCGGGYGTWDLVSGGWMWFPGERLAKARAWDLFWDLWGYGPRFGLGYGFGFGFRAYPSSRHFRGMTLARTDQGFLPAHQIAEQRRQATIDYQRRQATLDSSTHTGDQTKVRIDLVRSGPVVTLSPDGKEGGPSGRTAPTKPSIDPVRLGPRVEPRSAGVSPQSARQKPEGKAGDPLGRERHQPPAPSATSKLKSPRFPATGTTATGQSKIKRPTSQRSPATRSPASEQSKSKKKKKAPEQ